jgi:hypothetical protein
MKVCVQCGAEKPLTEFYKHKQMSDGYLNKCKSCKKEYQKEHRLENVEYYRSYDKQRQKNRDRQKAIQASSLRWRKRNPDKYKAQTAVGNAVRDGKLVKEPCQVCGDQSVHAHHEDYTKPLDVVWLCPKHHSEKH